MKKGMIFILFCLVVSTVNAQTLSTPFNYQDKDVQISVSPYSVSFWGVMPHTMKATVRYRMIELIYLYNFKAIEYSYQGGGIVRQQHWIGLFVLPLRLDYSNISLSVGAGYFFQPFPSNDGSQINFTLQLSYMLTKTIGLTYQHISNGFGIPNEFNPGLDNIGLIINI